MKAQEEINYNRIADAISYIRANYKKQPDLEEIAETVNLSPFHFQRLFSDWAGTTPKRFLQYISIAHAKEMLKDNQSLFNTALETGLSGTSRLHDLFVNIEGMTPGEYKNGGENLQINYSFAESPFGNIIVAATPKGICHMAFYDDQPAALANLQAKFPAARYQQMFDMQQQNALYIFSRDWSKLSQVKLHLKGTEFQLKVWEALLKIPMGKLATYGNLAKQLQNPNASRAVGTAIGDNPVAFLIPCHRVIQSSGALGGYHWGLDRKTAMIGWEAAKMDVQFK
ncbi:methylated-DNA--[protein]-cysteine S-methyltransferase [Pedobacter soli]|uniref:methylated-DNA--[protein]-cysteine S-methyltransferase n=1 Tax=Pedobacter soli TaxID=390242 RepID=A0A1G6XGN4_9SPHI|nr:methylated-DNA--[protein]-cysteine S-methyltransferase [Pedobacter soli]SDD76366.1 AraC family transcriptional regulator, regulatory protein of adaptative response / methylated-DNA-[protein]-cysteine methyltransferase [Pedobacter soli]